MIQRLKFSVLLFVLQALGLLLSVVKWFRKGTIKPGSRREWKFAGGRGNVRLVSRHGFKSCSGVVCPNCGNIVAKSGEEHLIRKTMWGEVILCLACGKQLLASPDDEIDPVKDGKPYDEEVYHTFVRSKRDAVVQRTFNRPVEVGDVVAVIENVSYVSEEGVKHWTTEDEGKVVKVYDTFAEVLPGGSLPGEPTYLIPLKCIAPKIFETYRPGVRVRVIQGPRHGAEGLVTSVHFGNVTVDLSSVCDDAEVVFPIEHLQVHEDQ